MPYPAHVQYRDYGGELIYQVTRVLITEECAHLDLSDGGVLHIPLDIVRWIKEAR